MVQVIFRTYPKETRRANWGGSDIPYQRCDIVLRRTGQNDWILDKCSDDQGSMSHRDRLMAKADKFAAFFEVELKQVELEEHVVHEVTYTEKESAT